MRFATDFLMSKTTWTGFITIATTIMAAVEGKISPIHAMLVVLGALHAIFMRDAIAKYFQDAINLIEIVSKGTGANNGGADLGQVAP